MKKMLLMLILLSFNAHSNIQVIPFLDIESDPNSSKVVLDNYLPNSGVNDAVIGPIPSDVFTNAGIGMIINGEYGDRTSYQLTSDVVTAGSPITITFVDPTNMSIKNTVSHLGFYIGSVQEDVTATFYDISNNVIDTILLEQGIGGHSVAFYDTNGKIHKVIFTQSGTDQWVIGSFTLNTSIVDLTFLNSQTVCSPPNGGECEKVMAFDAMSGDRYGTTVAITDNKTVFIGAIGVDSTSNPNATSNGAVYVYSDTNRNGLYGDELGSKLIPMDMQGNAGFGTSISSYMNKVAVGAPGEGPQGALFSTGSVYVYTDSDSDGSFDDEVPEKIKALDPQWSSRFGHSVALYDRTLIVGAWAAGNNQQGAVYIYFDSDNDGLFGDEVAQKIKPSYSIPGDYFGYSVAVSDNVVAVGALGRGNFKGAVYAYVDSDQDGDFSEETEQMLTPNGLSQKDNFGRSIAIVGSTLAIGAPFDDDGAEDSGSVYVYYDTDKNLLFDETAIKLTAENPRKSDNFGRVVAIQAGELVISKYQGDDFNYNSGSVYLYSDTNNNCIFDETPVLIGSPNAMNYDYIAHSLAITYGTLITGAPHTDESGTSSGSFYNFPAPLKRVTTCNY